MMRSHHRILAAAALCVLFAGHARAQEPIRFARMPDISPDGKTVAFSYLGDIWVVEAIGGVARPVTMHEKHDILPVFSPDGRKIAFSSNRHGNYDVFIVPVQGGKPTRITYDSADDHVCGWSPDGKSILFASTRSNDFPPRYELYSVPSTGGRATRISQHEGRDGTFSPSGDLIAYVRGPGTWYRKGYRGSANDDIWISNPDGSNNQRITTFDGQDNAPMWSSDGRHLYYVSDCCGKPGSAANIVRQELAFGRGSPLVGVPAPLTSHQDDSVRRARISRNGEWIVYECGADVWVVATKGGSPRKLAVEVNADDRTNPERTVTMTSGASEFAVSHDDRYIALVVHGEIFLMARGGGKAKRLTNSPAYDHGLAWSSDAKQIAFLSDRNGHEDIYLLESDDKDTSELIKANQFKVKQLTNTPEAEFGVNFSPDGKRVSFVRAGKLLSMNPDGSDVKVLVNEGTVIDYEWSPDSKWIAYARMDGSFANEIYVIPATGPTQADPARNVTRFATFNAGITWSKTGNRLAYISERKINQGPTVIVSSLQKPAVAGGTSPDFDWEDVHLRVSQPAPMNASECAISPDGSRVAFRSLQGGDDLWVASVDGKDIRRLTTGNMRPTQIQWSRGAMSSLLYFRDGDGSLRMLTDGSVGTPALVPFQAKLTINRHEEFAEMFEQSWRALHENFYDPNFHGANWKTVREKYRPLLGHVALKEDLYALISLMLGELNASHLGIQGPPPISEQVTADLGLIFDERFAGPGLKIAEILKRGPADKRGLKIKPGDIILSIDRVTLSDKLDLAKLLNDKVGEMVSLEVRSDPADPSARQRVDLLGVNRNQVRPLMYQRWIDQNAKKVAELSKGKLGYIHIPSMDEDGLNHFMRALYSDSFDKEAIVLDVRYNGGGFTHDKVLNYLGGREHTFFHQRHGGIGAVLRSTDRKWHKPMVLLINNRSYSDAEIFPHAFRTLGLGKLVGQPTGAHVIGTGAIRLIDGSMFRVPRTGVFTDKGVNMEREGVKPDFRVDEHPDEVSRGIDLQLAKAVEVLQHEVTIWKKNKSGVVVTPGTGSNPTPGPMLSPMRVLPPKEEE